MRKFGSAIIIVTVIFIFQSCRSGTKTNETYVDTVNDVPNDTTTASAPVAVQAAKQNVHPVELVPTVSAKDVKFASTAANDAINVVNNAKMALEKAASLRVKNFATVIANDHASLADELAAIAKKKSVTLPAIPGMAEMREANMLARKSGGDFDKAYIDAILNDQKKAITLFEAASQNCKDADLKTFAAKILPVLIMHLDSAQAIHDSMK